ncbi:MAG TPA: DUF4011 domain-containing protein, partial [Pyrinomonadaceae bacterium]|nr:DUF4011 domain-containing protein [Pyrinomonadaceae bacterium]
MNNEKVLATINSWKNKLLDLSKRNRALNFKINKNTTISIFDEPLTTIFRLLCIQKRSIRFVGFKPNNEIHETNLIFDKANNSPRTKKSSVTEFDQTDFTDDILHTNSTSESLDKSLRRIEQQSRTLVEEQGINSLFLTLGMLYYKDTGDSKIFLKAPILLIPVELSRKSAAENYTISMNDEEI